MKLKNKFFIIVILIVFILIIKLGDLILQKIYGLGNVVVYQNSIISGYTLKPNQVVKRKNNIIKINNLGMRSNNDWDEKKRYKNIIYWR